MSTKCLQLLSNKIHYLISVSPKTNICHVCPLAKRRKLSFTSHTHFASNLFDLMHCDQGCQKQDFIWGLVKLSKE